MLRIKTNKTNLYRLAKEKSKSVRWCSLPPMNRTRFWKAFRLPDYFLEWYTNGCSYRCYLAAVAGSPLLAIERSTEGIETHRQVFRLTVEDLQAKGMVEYIPDKGGKTANER